MPRYPRQPRRVTGNANPSDEVKTNAAELATYYSKARFSNWSRVDMIEAEIMKPTGGKPGAAHLYRPEGLRVTRRREKSRYETRRLISKE